MTPNLGVHRNIYHLQLEAAIKKVDRALAQMQEQDPTMYYMADYDELLEHRARLVEQARGLLA